MAFLKQGKIHFITNNINVQSLETKINLFDEFKLPLFENSNELF
jgi:hypothetical protein